MSIVIMCYRVVRDHCTWTGVRGASTEHGIGGIMPWMYMYRVPQHPVLFRGFDCQLRAYINRSRSWMAGWLATRTESERMGVLVRQRSLTVLVACSWTEWIRVSEDRWTTAHRSGGLPPHMPGAPSLSPAFPQLPQVSPTGTLHALPHGA